MSRLGGNVENEAIDTITTIVTENENENETTTETMIETTTANMIARDEHHTLEAHGSQEAMPHHHPTRVPNLYLQEH